MRQGTLTGRNGSFELFEKASPIEELASARLGSRPSYRPGGGSGITGIRAIPWVFGWTQNRLMLPGWLGAGTALSEAASEPGGLELLKRMADRWPFFGDLLARIDMVCAKADVEIARAYVEHLGGDHSLLDALIDRTLAEDLEGLDQGSRVEDALRKIAATMACHAAVKANYPLTLEKMRYILEELRRTAYSSVCPHGRPVVLRITRREVEKNFQRI